MDTTITLTAHRGYRQKFPENTMISFREALKLDVDSIEMDAHMTSDGEIVVMHDGEMSRTTDKSGKICNLTLAQVREADAGIKFGEQFKGEKVPTFEEFAALMATRPDVKLLLELKDYPEELGDFAYISCEKTLEICRKYGIWGKDRLTVITFSTGICKWIKTRHREDNITIHGFYPRFHMRGYEKDDPYLYIDEVCLFADRLDLNGKRYRSDDPVVEKGVFDFFRAVGIRPCVYFSWNVNEDDYRRALENGACGFTCDDAYTCGKILDKLGARKLRR